MQDANVLEIVDFLEKEQLNADFTEKSGRGLNRERYGIYDISNSSYGDFMIRFNEAHNSGKIVRYIDLRIPSIHFSKLVFEYNLAKKEDSENPEFTSLLKLVQRIKTKPSGLVFDMAFEKFNNIMMRHDTSRNATEKSRNACIIFDVINQMISMGPRNTKYVAIPCGYSVSVSFPGNGVERMNFERRSSDNGHETYKIEMPNVKITDRFNNYGDYMNTKVFEQAENYVKGLIAHETMRPGIAEFDRTRKDILDLMSEVVVSRYTTKAK